MQTWMTAAALGVTYLLLFLLERRWPLRQPKARLLPRLWVNVALSATALAAAAVFVRPAAGAALAMSEDKSFGLMPLAGVTGLPEILVSFLLMDLTFYYWHVANHRLPLLWRIHNVHHIDPDLDVSTGFRFHFAEVALSAVFRAGQVALIGPSITAFVVYELAFQTHTLFHHSNLRLPLGLERMLDKVIVTPRMHGIHHSNFRDETNSNFGVVFAWWDRLHRTLQLGIAQKEITVGIPGYSEPDDNLLGRCFLLPFRSQRDYWLVADGRRIRRAPAGMASPP